VRLGTAVASELAGFAPGKERFVFPTKQNKMSTSFRIVSDVALIHPAVQRVEAFVQQFGIDDASRLLLVLRELLMNAVYHGNGNDHGRSVAFDVEYLGQEQFRVSVEDEGRGFDYSALDLTIPDDPRRIRNRGYIVIRRICRSLEFNDRGNRVTVEVDCRATREEDYAKEEMKHGSICAR
jgi:anti-sigma regulatory factor (Ser/Thr protein kinase)